MKVNTPTSRRYSLWMRMNIAAVLVNIIIIAIGAQRSKFYREALICVETKSITLHVKFAAMETVPVCLQLHTL